MIDRTRQANQHSKGPHPAIIGIREAGLDPVAYAPRTWDDVHEVAQKIVQKDDNDRITRQAISFPFVASAAWYLLEFEPVLRELGGSILNEDQTESLVNSEAAVKTMETIKRQFDLGVSDKDIAASLRRVEPLGSELILYLKAADR